MWWMLLSLLWKPIKLHSLVQQFEFQLLKKSQNPNVVYMWIPQRQPSKPRLSPSEINTGICSQMSSSWHVFACLMNFLCSLSKAVLILKMAGIQQRSPFSQGRAEAESSIDQADRQSALCFLFGAGLFQSLFSCRPFIHCLLQTAG